MFFALVVAITAFLSHASILKGETVTLKKGDNPWVIHKMYTDAGNNFRHSEYRRINPKTQQVRILFKSTSGKVTPAQLRLFRRLLPGDQVVIPDKIVKYKTLEVKSSSVREICLDFGSPPFCTNILVEKNLLRNADTKLTQLSILVPKSYSSIIRTPTPTPSPILQTPAATSSAQGTSNRTMLFVVFGLLAFTVVIILLRYKYFPP